MITLEDFHSDDPVAWCPGCGNFSILKALKKALVALQQEPHELVIVSGIGQAPKTPHYLRCNCFNGLHGRTLPVASGIKLANHALTVLAQGGDGDGYGEGGNHFLHAMRRNINITYLVHNNQVYGLTKGQTSPTSDYGFVTNTTPRGANSPACNPLLLAIASDCSFVARGFAGEIDHLAGLIKAGIQHRGFAFIDILQPCVSFNRVNTFKWYSDRVYQIDDDSNYDVANRLQAFEKAQEWGDKIPIGVLYRTQRPTLEQQIPAIAGQPLVTQHTDPQSFSELADSFK
ncbi:MAG: 2-oxoacid:ferredoxin oxidoreductase subunit beta [Desulfobacteraceae bacterium]|jgi:2-oxoglutarate ferredoxin oxidoreductase subunit beta|nr:2-oxoacid:ferredoxin oxidoreductase subunit beta [Desulfobacteraceae bacterium]